MLNRLKKTYHEFPPIFWVIVGTLFIDAIGSTLLFPFFALYITQKFGVDKERTNNDPEKRWEFIVGFFESIQHECPDAED